jgi:hypothetical protein
MVNKVINGLLSIIYYFLSKSLEKNKSVELSKTESSEYYFDVIEGKIKLEPNLFIDRPLVDREGLILENAFDMLSEIANINCAKRVSFYIQGGINEYTVKKLLALGTLGDISDSRHEDLIYQYIDSENPDLSFIGLCSMCEMLGRKVLSENMANKVIERLLSIILERKGYEETVQAVIALHKVGYEEIDEILIKAKLAYPEIGEELERYEIGKK